MSLWRATTVTFVLGWVVAGLLFARGHLGVGDIGPTIESLVCYVLVWRCVNCGGLSFRRSTVKLVLSKEEKRARRDPNTTIAVVLGTLAAVWAIAVLLISRGSNTWLADGSMLAVIPVIPAIWVLTQRATSSTAGE